jgi:hypothetical protein
MRAFRPMTLANMRQNGVRAVTATCEACGREADVNVDALPETLHVPHVGRRLRCSQCGGKASGLGPHDIPRPTAPARQTITANDRQCPRPATATARPIGFDTRLGFRPGTAAAIEA